MKYLVALFVVSLALQPSGLQACAMDVEEPAGHHAHTQVDHVADCCQQQPEKVMDDCEPTTSCNIASVTVPAIPIGASLFLVRSDHHLAFTNDRLFSGPPGTALYRPPIT